jgi:hypothetical protein
MRSDSAITPTLSLQATARLVDDKRRLLVYILQGAIGSGVMELPLGVDRVEASVHTNPHGTTVVLQSCGSFVHTCRLLRPSLTCIHAAGFAGGGARPPRCGEAD